jgi:hypothetical protein
MAKLKLGAIHDDKPLKITVELSASVHRDLTAYADMLGQETSQPSPEVARLITAMIVHFMATDRGFNRRKKEKAPHNAMG